MAAETNVWVRLQSKTPIFFKRVQKIAGSLVILCGSLQAIPNLNPTISALSINGIVAGSIAILVAKFAMESTSPIEDSEPA